MSDYTFNKFFTFSYGSQRNYNYPLKKDKSGVRHLFPHSRSWFSEVGTVIFHNFNLRNSQEYIILAKRGKQSSVRSLSMVQSIQSRLDHIVTVEYESYKTLAKSIMGMDFINQDPNPVGYGINPRTGQYESMTYHYRGIFGELKLYDGAGLDSVKKHLRLTLPKRARYSRLQQLLFDLSLSGSNTYDVNGLRSLTVKNNRGYQPALTLAFRDLLMLFAEQTLDECVKLFPVTSMNTQAATNALSNYKIIMDTIINTGSYAGINYQTNGELLFFSGRGYSDLANFIIQRHAEIFTALFSSITGLPDNDYLNDRIIPENPPGGHFSWGRNTGDVAVENLARFLVYLHYDSLEFAEERSTNPSATSSSRRLLHHNLVQRIIEAEEGMIDSFCELETLLTHVRRNEFQIASSNGNPHIIDARDGYTYFELEYGDDPNYRITGRYRTGDINMVWSGVYLFITPTRDIQGSNPAKIIGGSPTSGCDWNSIITYIKNNQFGFINSLDFAAADKYGGVDVIQSRFEEENRNLISWVFLL